MLLTQPDMTTCVYFHWYLKSTRTVSSSDFQVMQVMFPQKSGYKQAYVAKRMQIIHAVKHLSWSFNVFFHFAEACLDKKYPGHKIMITSRKESSCFPTRSHFASILMLVCVYACVCVCARVCVCVYDHLHFRWKRVAHKNSISCTVKWKGKYNIGQCITY